MKLYCLIIISGTLLLSLPIISAADINASSINPALIYWQAISSMNELSNTEYKNITDILNNHVVFDEAKATSILTTRERSLKRFRTATTSTAVCDWGLTYEDGPFLPLPHVLKMQTLSRLALLKAEQLFAEHKTTEAIDWLFSVHVAARHCGTGDLIIPVLAQFTIEQAVIRTTAAHILEWDVETRMAYLSKFNTLPPLHTVKDAVNGEIQFFDWLEKYWLQDTQISIEPSTLASSDEDSARVEEIIAKFTPGEINKWLTEIRELYSKMQLVMDKPWIESDPALLALQSKFNGSDNLILKLITPTPLRKAQELAYKTDTYHTMLKAALQHGELLNESLIATYTDAFMGSPLMLKHTDDKSLQIFVSPKSYKGIGSKIELSLGPHTFKNK